MWSHWEGKNESIPISNGQGQRLSDYRVAVGQRAETPGPYHQGSHDILPISQLPSILSQED